MPAAKFEIIRKCKICGEEFLAKTIDSWYCSKRCSRIAWKRKDDERKRNLKLDEIVKSIPKKQDYIKATEAYALFGISRDTLYRLIHKGTISHINLGTKQIRVSKEELMKLYPLRRKALDKPKTVAKIYRMEEKDCYTIGEVSKKYKLDDSTVYLHIRKYSIPTRQIGNYVYVPKKEIDNLYKGMKI